MPFKMFQNYSFRFTIRLLYGKNYSILNYVINNKAEKQFQMNMNSFFPHFLVVVGFRASLACYSNVTHNIALAVEIDDCDTNNVHERIFLWYRQSE